MTVEDHASDTQEPTQSLAHTELETPTLDSTIQKITARVSSLEGELREAREKIKESETRRQIQRLLMEAQTIDVDAATLLAEAALRDGAATLEKLGDRAVNRIVDDLRRRKPLLFRSIPKQQPSAMSARVEHSGTPIASAAERAAQSGHRSDLLRYLRLRRTHLQESVS